MTPFDDIMALHRYRYGSKTNIERTVLKLCEETGEVAGAALDFTSKSTDETKAHLIEELGDLQVLVACMAEALGETPDSLMDNTYGKLRERGWERIEDYDLSPDWDLESLRAISAVQITYSVIDIVSIEERQQLKDLYQASERPMRVHQSSFIGGHEPLPYRGIVQEGDVLIVTQGVYLDGPRHKDPE